ncbi:MAG: hypothetical protein NTV51_00980, partial [Verrucomicrobia bacterium]|nr:hypothetical protein [Verrucomicrobiota bacterium]
CSPSGLQAFFLMKWIEVDCPEKPLETARKRVFRHKSGTPKLRRSGSKSGRHIRGGADGL